MSWEWFVARPAGGEILGELTQARDRKVTWRLRDQAEAGFTLTSGPSHDQSRLVDELRTDLIVTWNGRGHWRGRIGPTSDKITPSTHTLEVGAIDYRGILARRFTHTAIDLDDVDLAAAGWELIDHTQRDTGLDGGPLGIGRATLPAIAVGDVDYPVAKSIGEALDELAGRLPGFDWWIDADMLYRAAPWRGSVPPRDFALIWGVTVTDVDATFDPSGYANTLLQTGADGLDPAIAAAADLAHRAEGRWEAVEANTDLATQAAVDDTAAVTLARRAATGHTYTCRLRPGAWTPDDLWIGDLVRIVVRSGRRDVDVTERVLEITVTDTGDGPPDVDITVGNTLAGDVAAMLRRLPPTLTRLARRS